MKKIFALFAVVALMSLNIAFAAAEKGTISSSANANKEISPDTVEISVAVVTNDKQSMQNATKENKDISDKIYNAMKSMINPSNGDYVKTTGYSAQPQYNYVNNKRVFDKYQVSNRIIIHTKSTDKTGAMIDKAISLGATNIDNLNFSLSSYETQCDELLVKATQKARSRAESLAKAAGSKIVGVSGLNANCSPQGQQRVMYNMMMAKSAMMEDAAVGAIESTPIESGSVKLYANVNATFFVE